MGLYDGYRLANSNRIQEYQGSPVPEMVQVSQEMQKQYDQAQNNIDYTTRFFNSLNANDADKPELQKLRDKYSKSLKAISSRPDLENATRETSMLAQQLPQDYMPFAQNMQARAAYRKSLEDKYEKGDIQSRETIDKLMGLADKQSGTIQIDPTTGRYKANYRGYDPAKEIDKPKLVDEALAHANPTVIGSKGTVFSKDGKWLIDEEGKTRSLNGNEVEALVKDYMNSSEGWKSYMRQERLLGTYKDDYTHLKPENVNLQGPLENRIILGSDGKPVLDKKGKPQYTVYTVGDALKDKMQKGMGFGDAYKQLKQDMIEQQHVQEALKYAHKYIVNEHESGTTFRENPYYKSEHDKNAKPPAIPPLVYEGSAVGLQTIPSDSKGLKDALSTEQGNMQQLQTTLNNPNLDPVQREQVQAKLDVIKSNVSRLNSVANAVEQEVNARLGKDKLSRLTQLEKELTPPTTSLADVIAGKGPKSHKIMTGDAAFQRHMKQIELNNLRDEKDELTKKVLADKSKNFGASFSPKIVQLDKESDASKQLNQAIATGNPSIVIMDADGNILDDKKADAVRSHLKLNGITTDKIGDNHYMDATVETKDGKDVNVPGRFNGSVKNGSKYYVKFPGGANENEVAGMELLNKKNPQSQAIGTKLLSDFYSGKVADIPNNSFKTIYMETIKGNSIGYNIYKNVTPDGSTSYKITDGQGKVLIDPLKRPMIYQSQADVTMALSALRHDLNQ